MKIHCLENRSLNGPASFGMVWPKGEVYKNTAFILTGEHGESVPVQSKVTAYWPDGSVKWTCHTADAEAVGKEGFLSTNEEADPAMIGIIESDSRYLVRAGKTTLEIPKHGTRTLEYIRTPEGRLIRQARNVLVLSEERLSFAETQTIRRRYLGETTSVTLEENGPLKAVFAIRGTYVHEPSGRRTCPFVLRVNIYADSGRVDFEHTFIYEGNPELDALAGLGMEFSCDLSGAVYNRQVRFGLEHGLFAEAAVLLSSWRPRIDRDSYAAQINGEVLPEDGPESEPFRAALLSMPAWDRYRMVQENTESFVVEKATVHKNCCYIPASRGRRAPGFMGFGDSTGGFIFGRKDAWQKAPSGLEISGLTTSQATATVWFYSPEARSFDYRHYDIRSYNQSYYEGFDEVGAEPRGIANTNLFSLQTYEGAMPKEDALRSFSLSVQKPALYLADPTYYHDLHALGRWSLPKQQSPVENWIEQQLDAAIQFYKKEIEQRGWYGFYDYGDICHTYDNIRHTWKYDMGGYAWQNTELVPTLWLWLYFLRTQRDDVFVLAEAMSRHCSEVDTYHTGPYKGLGSRHNVRHWGCPCKEARIGMAGHHRYLYYLTGDPRMQDIFEDSKDADQSLINIDPLRFHYDRSSMVYPTHARSGPDWSSLTSNWMTQWERFNDPAYLEKIRTGIEDLKQMPLQLISGTDFEYDPSTSHLRYIGERAAGGTHLQICMGAAEVWMELADLLDDAEWTKMLADYGRFYYLPKELQLEESQGLIGKREFSLPFMAGSIAAFAAAEHKNSEEARKTWQILLHALMTDDCHDGFASIILTETAGQPALNEIPWITTNFVSQWCLNMIVALEFIRPELPKTWEEADALLSGLPSAGFHKA